MKSPTAPLHYPVDNIHICKNICQACLDPTSGPDRLSYRAHNTYVEVNFIQLKKIFMGKVQLSRCTTSMMRMRTGVQSK